MNINTIHAVYFSPAGSTEKIVTRIAESLAAELGAELQIHPYTLPEQRWEKLHFPKESLVIWGTPVYAGRIPNKTLDYVKNCFRGEGGPAIPVVVYGNRNFDQALSELTGILREGNLQPVAAAAMVARHVFSEVLAAGRPDEEDLAELDAFTEEAAEKVKRADRIEDLPPIQVPGPYPPDRYYTPLGEDGTPAKFLKALPVIDEELCTGCGTCIGSCPMGSIKASTAEKDGENAPDRVIPVISGICIKCSACVRKCPFYAICIKDEAFQSHKRMLDKTFLKRKKASFVL